jgi:hypothetical protein
MKLGNIGRLLAATFLAGASLVSPALRADNNSVKQATVTIQSPEQVPGSVLPAGTYVFKQSGSQSGWTIVQIYNNDDTAIVTTVLAYPNPKVASNGQNVVTYPANGAGSIPAIEGFVFTGDSTVEQFAYPRTAADQIGSANHTRIPTTGTDDAYPSALPDAASSWSAPVTNNASADATSDTTLTAQNTAPTTDNTVPAATETTQRDLPQTASPLPLVMLIGLLAVCGIVILRKVGRGRTSKI